MSEVGGQDHSKTTNVGSVARQDIGLVTVARGAETAEVVVLREACHQDEEVDAIVVILEEGTMVAQKNLEKVCASFAKNEDIYRETAQIIEEAHLFVVITVDADMIHEVARHLTIIIGREITPLEDHRPGVAIRPVVVTIQGLGRLSIVVTTTLLVTRVRLVATEAR